jgi:phage-related tail protein
MKRYNFILSLALLFSGALLFSSCESSKIAYGNSYYFKQTPKKMSKKQLTSEESMTSNHQENSEAQKTGSKEAYVSTEVMDAEKSIQEKIEKVEQKIEKMKVLEEQKQERQNHSISLSKAEKKAFKKEKKAVQKALKKEVKALAKEYKKAPEEVKKQNDVSGNLRTGIILGAAGLVLLIIGSGNPILYALGTVLVVVGVVLILIDVL